MERLDRRLAPSELSSRVALCNGRAAHLFLSCWDDCSTQPHTEHSTNKFDDQCMFLKFRDVLAREHLDSRTANDMAAPLLMPRVTYYATRCCVVCVQLWLTPRMPLPKEAGPATTILIGRDFVTSRVWAAQTKTKHNKQKDEINPGTFGRPRRPYTHNPPFTTTGPAEVRFSLTDIAAAGPRHGCRSPGRPPPLGKQAPPHPCRTGGG